MVRLPATLPREPLIAIDLLRLAAALSVMAFHYGGLATSSYDLRLSGFIAQERLPASVSRWFQHGWIGVEIFFVISGYVIAMSAVGSSRSAFIRRRVLRLLPTAWLCATITLVALLVVRDYDIVVLLRQLLFSVTLFPIGEAIDPSYWTIGVELSFYAVVAACIKGEGAERALLRIATALGVMGAVFWGGVLVNAWPYHWGRLSELLLLEHGCLFALGAMIRLHSGRIITPTLGTVLAVLTLECMIEIFFHRGGGFMQAPLSALPPIAAFLVAVIVIVIAPMLQSARPTGRVTQGASLMGKATYPIYLLHQTAGAIVIGELLLAGVDGYLALAMTAVLIITLAIGITVGVEPKLRRFIGDRFMQQTAHRNHAPAPDSRPIASPSTG